MNLRCRGCAGCCLDWRPLVDRGDRTDQRDGRDESGRSPYPSLDGAYNLVPLERDEVRAFVDAGYGDALTPRLWRAGVDDPHVEVGAHRVAAVAGRPAFFVGLRKPSKPVAPFGREEATWLPTCAFLDPETLQCRIYGDELYPAECDAYPKHNVALGQETECERVEAATGERRLLSAELTDVDDSGDRLLLGPQAIGGKVFCHPDPDAIADAVDRIADGATTRADRAEFVAVAAASSPGTLATSEHHYEDAFERTTRASSWVGDSIDEWGRLAETTGADRSRVADPAMAESVEVDRGAPETPGWESVDDE
ncbi:YkgJ family cysteine cluster protein [Halovivax gelatinilyticus]|uniref:YkgJ family cysteine cluster protein n=1 Tax=Halovivax gelatinilyticus TaxID=2961597 RepID=UPI0020CA4AF0|nr:YkgJ family cysteine cluster protein [Halovivax gelatinilyticus]